MKPIPLIEPIKSHSPWYLVYNWPLFNLGFRALFLIASLWACLGMGLWYCILNGLQPWQSQFPATLWHAHEMIFAFAATVAVGFLFTASQNWTGQQTLHGFPLLLMTLVWIATRLLIVTNAQSLIVAFIGQSMFWLIAISHLSYILLSSHSKNNYVFIYILGALCVANLTFIGLLLLNANQIAVVFTHIALLIFTLLIAVIGGRVIPFFTARGLQLDSQVRSPQLDKWLIRLSTIGIGSYALQFAYPTTLIASVALGLTAILHVIRVVLWFNAKILQVPLLWSLHCAYCATSFGLLWFALSLLIDVGNPKDALHLITVGGIGLMILAMMARVSLGHTARPLVTHWLTNLSFLLCLVAGITRAILPNFIAPHLAWQWSALLWVAAFFCFVLVYLPILTKPRIDGHGG
ncbi:NnrS protein involved in response to NO [Pseudoalteromonas luteoviolacea B = ATCC 29581]|nr:NnrS protein involved in response to NO [Pseudoalteromonas luteoviolacea B = ATCC 29581]